MFYDPKRFHTGYLIFQEESKVYVSCMCTFGYCLSAVME